MAKSKNSDRTGLYIPAGLFIGMGAGFLFDQLVAGIFLGMGLGMLGMAHAKRGQKQ